MVLLLNLIPVLIVLGMVASILYFKSLKATAWTVVVTALVMVVYMKAQPSYLPKGDIVRSEVPEFVQSTAEIQDRNRKPVPSEVRQERMEAEYRQGTVK